MHDLVWIKFIEYTDLRYRVIFCPYVICAYFLAMLDVPICISAVIINVRAQQLLTMYDWRISTLVHRGRQRISNRWQHKVSNTVSFDNAALCNVQPEIRQGYYLYKVQLKVRLLLAQDVFVLRTEQTTLAHYNWLELLLVCSCTGYLLMHWLYPFIHCSVRSKWVHK